MQYAELVRKEALRRGYSRQTISTYVWCLHKFFRQCRKDPKEVTKQDVYRYLDRMVAQKRAGSTLNVHHSALQFLFSQVLHKKLLVEVKYSKTPKRLPEFLTKEEVVKLLEMIGNPKHKLMVSLLYSAGLRVSELISLKVRDLELGKGYGWVREGKGKKDRPFIIADRLRSELNILLKDKSFEDYLFVGHKGKIGPSTLRAVLKQAAKKAAIKKNIHPHTLRHSFATHLHQNDYATTDVQSLLGHSRMETTLVYTHLANPKLLGVKSPFDSLYGISPAQSKK